MEDRFRSWWQYIRKHRVAAIITTIVVVIVFIFAGYWFDWTGFNGYTVIWLPKATNGTSLPITRLEEQQPAKALWDWLQLLFIPAILTLGAVWLTTRQNHDREIAEDAHQQVALQNYIDKMSELLLEKHLRQSKPDDEVRIIARVRTLAVLVQLDPARKRILTRFLQESGLINKDDTIVNLDSAALYDADLHNANLRSTNLIHCYLDKADLDNAQLIGADLTNAILIGANLTDANLTDANLTDANLANAKLIGANLTDANLMGANLMGANLKGVFGITIEELEKQAKSLQGATMPDGSIHP